MGLTVIRALVNMSPYDFRFFRDGSDFRPTGALESYVPRFDTVACDIAVPWVTSEQEFNAKHLRVELLAPYGNLGALRTVTLYTIWQESINGVDLVRFSNNAFYVPNADGVAAFRAGTPPYQVVGDSDCILVVDERQCLILTRLAR